MNDVMYYSLYLVCNFDKSIQVLKKTDDKYPYDYDKSAFLNVTVFQCLKHYFVNVVLSCSKKGCHLVYRLFYY